MSHLSSILSAMFSRRRYLCALCGLLLPVAGYSATPAAIENTLSSGLVEVGRGEMDWLWFNVYKAKLMTSTGKYQSGIYPQLLDIEYYRDIEANDLLEATADQWRHLGYTKDEIANWLQLLKGIWPNVVPGDHLSFKLIDAQRSQFFFNGQPLGIIEEPKLAEAFLAIWLSTNTSRPTLRAQLLGEKSCDC
ncbi:chalcone isomerase family protein [Shewanella mangrovisoli]|uniref:chalcone isomerase family protein n=1 Tax=Shewanella mangrovisoli TaxID=2864211 RepID=UPI0035B96C2D